jgi:hypothetical protein
MADTNIPGPHRNTLFARFGYIAMAVRLFSE